MGEIMRWRLTRAAQRRVPAPESLLQLPGLSGITPAALNAMVQAVQANGAAANNPTLTSYSAIVASPTALRQYLSTPARGGARGGARGAAPSSPAPTVMQEFLNLLQLDQWLAANSPQPPAAPPYTIPVVTDLNNQISGLGLNPSSAPWQTLFQILCDIYYFTLVASALKLPYDLTEVLGFLTRWLLVMGLVDDLEANNSPIQTPDDVYAALRWRTLVLPDMIALLLFGIRLTNGAVLVRKPGFADLYITREEWDHYEPAEIASIENILKGELLSRVHVLVNQTVVTTTTEQSTTTLKEQDSTTTDLTQLQQQSSSDVSIAAHVSGQVDTSSQFGTTQVNTHLAGSLDYSNSAAVSKATTQSHETVSRSVSQIQQTTRQVRTVSTLTREKDKEEHKFDNTTGQASVVGIYRWVDQIQNVELDRYPHRFLMEFELPEPGAWTRWLHLNDAARNMINKPPIPLTATGLPTDPPLQPSDLGGATYPGLVARYNAAGVSPPPEAQVVVSENLTYPQPGGAPENKDDWHADSNLTVPNGYYALNGFATVMASFAASDGEIDIALGAGAPVQVASPTIETTQVGLNVGPISIGNVPISVLVHQVWGFTLTVELTCQLIPETYKQWQEDAYDQIVGAYNAMLQAYNNERAGLSIQETNLVDAYSPDQNSLIITQELKRQAIQMLIGSQFSGIVGDINWDPAGVNPPTTNLSLAASSAPEVQFLEQAFEWETLSYICYPYYWADAKRWADLAVIQGNDSNFADFLRSGSARVVLAARPGFEDQVNFYVQYGILWGGGPMPAPGDPNYLSIADEIKEMQQRPLDVTVIDTWQVRLPTTLIWLQTGSDLPKNPSPTIITTPAITNLTPNSGAVGDAVVISGTNFGDVEGSSTVTFNRAAASASAWSANSIVAMVPGGAATGPVVVTVNGVASNAVAFTVVPGPPRRALVQPVRPALPPKKRGRIVAKQPRQKKK